MKDKGKDLKETETPTTARPTATQQRERSERTERSERYDRGDRSRDRSERSDRPHRERSESSSRYDERDLSEFSLTDLYQYARRLGIIGASLMSKTDLIKKIEHARKNPEADIEVVGVLEKLPDGFGFLRSARFDYVSGPDDVYVSPSQIRRFGLRTGDTINGVIRKPKEGEKYFALLQINKVNQGDPVALEDRYFFENLTPLHPEKKFNLESDENYISTRIMDIFSPIGKGQRSLIVAPPKAGKTILLKELAKSILANHPEVYLIVLLIDERPEEVSEMRRGIIGPNAEVVSSTFDEVPERHIQVAEIVLEKAKRMVEQGKDVVILLDAITRLARAYNTVAPASGKVLTGGIDAHALQRPKRFFGAARKTEEAGSLTIIATALVETGSRMDEVIFEEFKGTGNMEINLSRKLANRRIFPAFDLMTSGTRREELLLSEDELNKAWVLRKFLSTMNLIEGMEFLIDKMKKFKTNEEFFESINKKQTPTE
ncbi:MAG: transcription termination factor Rho [Candidatus Babeliales bacterium]